MAPGVTFSPRKAQKAQIGLHVKSAYYCQTLTPPQFLTQILATPITNVKYRPQGKHFTDTHMIVAMATQVSP